MNCGGNWDVVGIVDEREELPSFELPCYEMWSMGDL
jgi:hypothetical protein